MAGFSKSLPIGMPIWTEFDGFKLMIPYNEAARTNEEGNIYIGSIMQPKELQNIQASERWDKHTLPAAFKLKGSPEDCILGEHLGLRPRCATSVLYLNLV